MAPAEELSIEFDVPARMSDGTVLRANVYRPAGEGRWPVLLTRLPYGKDYALGSSVLDPVQAARRGYVVIVQDTRGRFRSEGQFYPYRNEEADGMDTVAWAAALPYSDGQVGMYGASYFGQTQWLAARGQPPALKALVPYITFNDNLNGHGFRSGAFELGMTVNWLLGMGFDLQARNHAGDLQQVGMAFHQLAGELDRLAAGGFTELPLRRFGPLERTGVGLNFRDATEHVMDREYSGQGSLSGEHEKVLVPTYNIGGWYDCFLGDTLLNYQEMRRLGRTTKLLIGPWTHSRNLNPIGELNFGYAASAALIDLRTDFYSLQLRWFDHFLKGIDQGVLAEPPVKIFVMGANRWRDENEWPLKRAAPTAFHLRSGGRLSPAKPGSDESADAYQFDPADPVPTRGGNTLLSADFPGGPYDQTAIEARADVLTYSTEPLPRDTEVTGPVTVRLWAASSATDTDWVARLCDVHPDGRSINLCDGIVRARYRDFRSGGKPSLIEPGAVLEYEIDLWATSNLFRAGHRIRLVITSSSFPRWDRNPNTGHDFGADAELQIARQTIFHDASRPSWVLLPLVQD